MKYLYIDNDRIVREIIPALDERFPGIPITQRYAKSFLDKCLEVGDDVAVEPGMEYLPLANRFVYPIRYVGTSQVTIHPGEMADVCISFVDSKGNAPEGIVSIVDPVPLTYQEIENGYRFETVPEGIHSFDIRLEAVDGRTITQTITITAKTDEPSQLEEPEEIEPSLAEQLQAENKTLKAQVSALSEQNDFQEELIVELANVVYA